MAHCANERCKNLKCDSDTWRWSWTINGIYFETDNDGEGIWVETDSYDFQITGTSQFSLHGMSASGARKKINRFFSV